mmetsp:Transcript_7120/g.20977  ORF Transcript_7120/g.20977 Transcript_7120/m.20977 type:complete len:219 (-) Transcript_7120:1736-2392(-)
MRPIAPPVSAAMAASSVFGSLKYLPAAASAISFARPVDTNLFSVSSMSSEKPGMDPSCFAVSMSSSLSAARSGLAPGSGASAVPRDTSSGTFARPSPMHTTTTFPTSPDFCAFMPVRAATDSACAKGEPPPQAMVSRRFFVSAMDRVGGTSTSAVSPWKGMSEIWSRDWYASVSSDSAAPLAACMRLSAMEPDASTTKMMSEPALRAMRFDRTSLSSM